MIKTNIVQVKMSRKNKFFEFNVIEILDSSKRNVEFEIHPRPLNKLEVRDFARHMMITEKKAEEMILEVAQQQHGGKMYGGGVVNPAFNNVFRGIRK